MLRRDMAAIIYRLEGMGEDLHIQYNLDIAWCCVSLDFTTLLPL